MKSINPQDRSAGVRRRGKWARDLLRELVKADPGLREEIERGTAYVAREQLTERCPACQTGPHRDLMAARQCGTCDDLGNVRRGMTHAIIGATGTVLAMCTQPDDAAETAQAVRGWGPKMPAEWDRTD